MRRHGRRFWLTYLAINICLMAAIVFIFLNPNMFFEEGAVIVNGSTKIWRNATTVLEFDELTKTRYAEMARNAKPIVGYEEIKEAQRDQHFNILSASILFLTGSSILWLNGVIRRTY